MGGRNEILERKGKRGEKIPAAAPLTHIHARRRCNVIRATQRISRVSSRSFFSSEIKAQPRLRVGKVPLLVGWMYGREGSGSAERQRASGDLLLGLHCCRRVFFFALFFCLFLPPHPPSSVVLEMLDAVLFVKQLTCQVSLIMDKL